MWLKLKVQEFVWFWIPFHKWWNIAGLSYAQNKNRGEKMGLLGMDTCPSLNDIMEIRCNKCTRSERGTIFNDRVRKDPNIYYFGAIFWNHDQEKKKLPVHRYIRFSHRLLMITTNLIKYYTPTHREGAILQSPKHEKL
jgi:hypothetical protein